MARSVEGTRGWVALLSVCGVAQLTCHPSGSSDLPTEEVTTRTSAVTAALTNVASQAKGGFADASSTYSAGYAADYINNGDRKGVNWGNGGGWNDATSDEFPDYARVVFNGVYDVSEVDIFSVQDNYTNPIEPTPTMTFSQYGLTDFDIQYWHSPTASWVTVPGGHITGNNLVWRKLTFPAIRTTQIRVRVNNALNSWSRVVELEAYALTNGWGFLGPNGCTANPSNPSAVWSGTVLDVEQVPGTGIYRLASSAGGLFQYDPSPTGHWVSITSSLTPSGSPPLPAEGLAFSAIATKPSNTNLILAGSGDLGSNAYTGYVAPGSGIWRTTDGGMTWSNVLPRAQTGNIVFRIVWNKLSSLSTVHAVTDAGYFRSTNDGQTWTLVAAGMATDIGLNPSNDSNILIGVPSVGVRQSLDGGQIWSTVLSAATFNRTMLSWSTSGIVYAASEDYSVVNKLVVWKSTNSGASWTQLSFGFSGVFNQCNRDIAVATDPAGQVVLTGCDGTVRSTQGGASGSWTDVTTSNVNFFGDVHVMKFVDANTVLVGDDHGYHYSTDKGATWKSDLNVIPIDNVMNFDVGVDNPNVLWTASWDNGVKRSLDGGKTCQGFMFQPIQGDAVDVLVDPGNAHRVWATDRGAARFRTADDGATWSTTFTGLPAPQGWVKFKHDQIPSVWLYTQAGKGIYQSTDGGANWGKYPGGAIPDFPNPVFDFAVGRYEGGVSVIYAVFAGAGPMKVAVIDPVLSATGWTDITTGHGLPTGITYGGFAVSDVASGRAFFTAGNRVFKTTNRGQQWSEITGNLPTLVTVVAVVENPSNENIIYAATHRGVYKTTDNGTTWRTWMSGLPPGGVIPANLKGKTWPTFGGAFRVAIGLWGGGVWLRDGFSDDP